MKRPSPTSDAVRASLAEHFELFLTTFGVLLAILVTLSELSSGEQDMTLIFLIWLQGLILWAVHRHGWFQRRALVQDLDLMPYDLVGDRLALMLSMAELRIHGIIKTEGETEESIAAARTVWLEIEKLSLEFELLRSNWERHLNLLRI